MSLHFLFGEGQIHLEISSTCVVPSLQLHASPRLCPSLPLFPLSVLTPALSHLPGHFGVFTWKANMEFCLLICLQFSLWFYELEHFSMITA